MRVFLTGATGAVGSSVFENLLSHGHNVTFTVRNEEKGREITAKNDRASFIVFDINANSVHQLVEIAAGYDAIIHCARQEFNQEGSLVESMTVDALISAAKKTAESKQITLICTSGILVNGYTTEIIDEDHDDTSHCWEILADRKILEKKVINASTENLHGVIIRVGAVYGKSGVDHWIRACKSENKILVANQGNASISFIHHEDLANMYRIAIEKRAYGLFFGVEPESVSLEDMIAKVEEVGDIHEVERIDNPWEHASGPYGYFLLAHPANLQLYPKRFIELYDFHFTYKFLEWINSFVF